jgi:flagellar motor switch protein FliM
MRLKTETAVREMPVPSSVRLPKFEISVRELMALSVGKILPTGIPKDAKLIIRTGDQERFIGQAGRVGNALAVRIHDGVTPADG